jgi:tetratricopeptide (TPR) repeat protein
MTFRLSSVILAACLLASSCNESRAQQESPAITPEAAAENEKFGKLISEAQQFQAESKLLDAMEKINEAEALKPGTAILHNMRGSVYTAMRDFDKAQEQFEKAQALHPGAFEPRFNLLELQYVRGNYAEAEKGFAELLQTYPKLRVEIRHITLFKILVSQLKLDKLATAEETMKNFTFMDDTPAYYYARAAMFFQKGDKIEGHTWVNKAAQIFKQPEQTVPYIDSLIEARWIDSLGIPDELK